jgi:hypothetical protein
MARISLPVTPLSKIDFGAPAAERDIETIRWSDAALLKVIAKRIRHSVPALAGCDDKTCWESLFSAVPGPKNNGSFSYMVDRTLYRPREIIQFCTQHPCGTSRSTRCSGRTWATALPSADPWAAAPDGGAVRRRLDDFVRIPSGLDQVASSGVQGSGRDRA